MTKRDGLPALAKRDIRGRFVRLVCVNAHDRCYLGGPCPLCEVASPRTPLGQAVLRELSDKPA